MDVISFWKRKTQYFLSLFFFGIFSGIQSLEFGRVQDGCVKLLHTPSVVLPGSLIVLETKMKQQFRACFGFLFFWNWKRK